MGRKVRCGVGSGFVSDEFEWCGMWKFYVMLSRLVGQYYENVGERMRWDWGVTLDAGKDHR